ncbi:hypothetical protein HY024_04210 [Candidatus Curtissbacteria bacterium]|nr:hypothetical protein [Candidatus Curtissbacteria bacterium]
MNQEAKIINFQEITTGELHSLSFRACGTIVTELKRSLIKVNNGIDVGVGEASIRALSNRFDIWVQDCLSDIAVGRDNHMDELLVQLKQEELHNVEVLLIGSIDNATAVVNFGNSASRQRASDRLDLLNEALVETFACTLVGARERENRISLTRKWLFAKEELVSA